MHGIARIAELGLWAAAGICAALMIFGIVVFDTVLALGLLVTPVAVTFSSAVIAFVVLRHGEAAAVRTGLIAAVVVLVFSAVTQTWSVRVPLFMIVGWIGAGIVAVVLKRTVRLDLAVLSAVPLAVLTVLAGQIYRAEIAHFWQMSLRKNLGNLNAEQSQSLQEQGIFEMMDSMALLMASSVGNWSVVIVVCALFLARSWQAKMFNMGGFQQEFHSLKLGKQAVWACVGAFVLALITGMTLWSAIASVLMFVFFIQGLSVLHSIVKQRELSQGWLVGIYLMMLIPQLVLLIGALGLADNLIRLRQT